MQRLRKRGYTLLEPPGESTGAFQPAPMLEAGEMFAGRYKLREKLGEGGMGVVFVADQLEPVQRRVALKIIKSGTDTARMLARFGQERQALALMDHPNIAKVFDAGVSENGVPYFAMELIKGVPITKYCDDAKLTPKQRLELFVPVCQAVQHAHQKGIIHRDLKPSNILIGLYDGRPVPKVIDFGVAKATGLRLTEQSIYTEVGSLIGTLEYMSPEQAELNNLDIDTRSDIYALGVILYELLTGSVPFSRKDLQSAGFAEMLRIIKEQEPSKPSTKLSGSGTLPGIAAVRQMEPKKLMALMRGELDWIVMKALEKDRSRRYETANGFAADVQRYLSGEAVLAHPPSTRYRLKKFLRKNRGPVIAATLVTLALIGGIIGTTFGLIRADKRRIEAEQARTNEAEQRQLAEAAKKQAEQAEADTLADYRASTDDAIEQLIGSKPALGPQEKAYLEKTLKRWQVFAARTGDDDRSQAIRAEGHQRVAYLWQKLGRLDEARVEHERALTLWNKLAEQIPPVPRYQKELALTHNNLGLLLSKLGNLDEARTEYEKARDLHRKLAEQFPAIPAHQQELSSTHNNLGILLARMGRRGEARTEYERSRDLRQKLADQFPEVPMHQHQLARIRISLGTLFYGLGRRDEALSEYKAVHDLLSKLADQFPSVPAYQQDLAGNHNNLGLLLVELGNRDHALSEYKTARDLLSKLAGQFPAVPEYQQDRADNHNNLGLLFAGLGRPDEAHREYEKALELNSKLADQFPKVPGYQQELASTHNNLGALLASLGRRDEAGTQYEKARDLRRKLAEQFPKVPGYQIDLGGSYCNFGIWIRDGGKPEESLAWFGKAIQTLTAVHEREPRDVTAKRFLKNSHSSRAMAFDRVGKHAEAVKDWDKAIDLSPVAERPSRRAERATSRIQAGQVSEGVAEVADLTKSPNWNAAQWYDFACAYAIASGKDAGKKQEYADRAMELLQKAVTSGYKDAAHMAKDTDLDPLRGRDDIKKLLAELAKANPAKNEPKP